MRDFTQMLEEAPCKLISAKLNKYLSGTTLQLLVSLWCRGEDQMPSEDFCKPYHLWSNELNHYLYKNTKDQRYQNNFLRIGSKSFLTTLRIYCNIWTATRKSELIFRKFDGKKVLSSLWLKKIKGDFLLMLHFYKMIFRCKAAQSDWLFFSEATSLQKTVIFENQANDTCIKILLLVVVMPVCLFFAKTWVVGGCETSKWICDVR